ncbi:MAG: acetylxylan esterase [Planctomycetes bacterium]|nr:acetylxylan esterase [Planctomycetota bacterium]
MFDHDYDFDPTCGYSEAELLRISPPDTEPADFEEFWRDTYRKALSTSLKIDPSRIWSPRAGTRVDLVYFTSWEGSRIGGWLVRPEGKILGGAVITHGYGGRSEPEFHLEEMGFACFMPCIRGFGLSWHPRIPWQAGAHVLHGIESRNDYVLRGCVADIWLAASVLCQICPEAGEDLVYVGGSVGGGLGALALPWDDRFKRALLVVPTFGHHPLRLEHPCAGSAASVREYTRTHPDAVSVLATYDAATAAKYIDIPVFSAPALFDPAVIPPGQFAVTNSLKAPGSRLFIKPAGHFAFQGEDAINLAQGEESTRFLVNAT